MWYVLGFGVVGCCAVRAIKHLGPAPPQQRRKQSKCCVVMVPFLFYPFIPHTPPIRPGHFTLPGPGPNLDECQKKTKSCCYLPLGHDIYNAQAVANSFTMLHQ